MGLCKEVRLKLGVEDRIGQSKKRWRRDGIGFGGHDVVQELVPELWSCMSEGPVNEFEFGVNDGWANEGTGWIGRGASTALTLECEQTAFR